MTWRSLTTPTPSYDLRQKLIYFCFLLFCLFVCLFVCFFQDSLCPSLRVHFTTMKLPTAVLLVQATTFVLCTAIQQCSNSAGSHHGLALLSYVYHALTTDRLMACYIACNLEPTCQSLNYNLEDKTCEFNSVVKSPGDLVERKTSVYAVNPDRGKPLF